LDFFTSVFTLDFFLALVSLVDIIFDFDLFFAKFGVFMNCSMFLALLPFTNVLDGGNNA
jgi:hypothetical protein